MAPLTYNQYINTAVRLYSSYTLESQSLYGFGCPIGFVVSSSSNITKTNKAPRSSVRVGRLDIMICWPGESLVGYVNSRLRFVDLAKDRGYANSSWRQLLMITAVA